MKVMNKIIFSFKKILQIKAGNFRKRKCPSIYHQYKLISKIINFYIHKIFNNKTKPRFKNRQ
jgi:hypothetical protein